MKPNKKTIIEITKEFEQYEWFNNLDDETKNVAIEQEMEFRAPIDDLQETFNNIYIFQSGKWEDWLKARKEKFPFALQYPHEYMELTVNNRPDKPFSYPDNQMIRRFKRQFINDLLVTDQRAAQSRIDMLATLPPEHQPGALEQ